MGKARRAAQARAARARTLRLAAAAAVVVVGIVVAVVLASGGDGDDGPVEPAALFRERCAACHGDRGQGLTGPKLADGAVVERFPDVADQIELVTRGAQNMPPFGGVLSDAEIEAVVEYTRSLSTTG